VVCRCGDDGHSFALGAKPNLMRVFLHTFGCKANQYDTELIRQSVEEHGGHIVRSIDEADAVVVNSCTVTQSGEAKLRNLIRRTERRAGAPRAVVVGCAATVDDGTIAAMQGVSAVVGGVDPSDVLEALGLEPKSDLSPTLKKFSSSARAWLKIQDGCDEHCTFCATVLARGSNRSRSPAEILTEAKALAEHHEELVLTGVHIGSYGADLEEDTSLSKLLEWLIASLPGVRFRLSSVEATEVDERLEELMSAVPDRLAPHLHAPLQSGSDRILKRMGRHWYDAKRYRERIERLAGKLQVFGLGADVMVGFPGETDDDFTQTLNLVNELPFTYLHVFPYSERPNTAAPRLGNNVPSHKIKMRSEELRALGESKQRAYQESRVGMRADVVVLGRHGGVRQGVTEDYLDVEIADTRDNHRRIGGTIVKQVRGKLLAEPVGAR